MLSVKAREEQIWVWTKKNYAHPVCVLARSKWKKKLYNVSLIAILTFKLLKAYADLKSLISHICEEKVAFIEACSYSSNVMQILLKNL